MKYDLIISDFDGTFRHRDTTIGERNISAVRAFVERGGHFAICTGRMPTSIRPILQELGMGGVYAAYQGSLIGEVDSGKYLRESGFTEAQALFVCRTMQEMGLWIHAYDEANCYVNYSDRALQLYEEICRIRAVQSDDLEGLISTSGKKFFKLIAMVAPERCHAVRDELQRRLGTEEYYVSCSASVLVEVTAVQDTKAAAVAFLGEHYGVSQEKILAFGDHQNDAPLLQAAGHGVAVGNADDSLKSVADEILTDTCDEDAVGRYIEKVLES